jgi:hypothetical protein
VSSQQVNVAVRFGVWTRNFLFVFRHDTISHLFLILSFITFNFYYRKITKQYEDLTTIGIEIFLYI